MSRKTITQALDRACESEAFVRSKRLRRFLRYVVEETLNGRWVGLKGYSIGLAVFDRPEDFDPESDSIVRVEAQRLRQALKLYYLEEGRNDPLRIDLPKGGYVPTFSVLTYPNAEKTDTAECRASVTVVPIENLSGDPTQDYFAVGLMHELTTTLGSYREVQVISSNAGGISTDWKNREGAKCARFLLHGSARISEHNIRVNIELVDTRSGKQLWTSRYKRDRTADDLFTIQENIANDVILQVADRYGGAINRTLITDTRHANVRSLNTYEAVLTLHDYNKNASVDTYRSALNALEAAVKAHPEHAMTWATLAELRSDGYAIWGVDDDREKVLAEARQHAARATTLDPINEYGYVALGLINAVARDTRTLVKTAEHLLSLEPPPSSVALGAWFLALAGQWKRGLEILEDHPKVLRSGPGWLHHVLFLDHYRQGRYREALDAAESFAMPGLFWDPIDRAAALGMLGRFSEGQTAVAEIHDLRPDFAQNPRRYLECYILQDDLLDLVIEGLEKAGMRFGERVVSLARIS